MFRFVLGVCLILGSFALSCHAEDLNATERDYLQALGKVRMCVDPDWPPFEKINESGEHEGIAADLIRLAASRTGFELELVRTQSWGQSIDFSKAGKCHILSFLNQTAKREEWLVFSDPIFTDPNVFITREEHDFISDPATLANETLILPKGTAMQEFIEKDYPNLIILPPTSESETMMMKMVSERKASMTMRSLIVAAYTIKKEGLFNLKIAGQLPRYENKLRVGVLKSEPMLRDIINKGIKTITPTERGQIINRHVSINVQTVVDYTAVFQVAAVLGIIAAISFYWNYRLRLVNEQLARLSQTDTLTELYNRRKIDSEFSRALAEARSSHAPLTVILIDIDHFKKVNDAWGHMVGDQVIRTVGKLIREGVRAGDSVGRWGGEEYLVICPRTDGEAGGELGCRLVERIGQHRFEGVPRLTISAGVSTIAPGGGDDSHGLLVRADQALYRAKANGRNQVCRG
jgi:diguanylate cyclase (GGDEF)-like protein